MAPPALVETEHTTMGRLIVANRRGHQVVEWDTVDTEEARQQVIEAERILREARESGCLVSRKVGDQHVIDHQPFDPSAEEYQIVAPIAGG
jgi:hypothetical protein